MTMRNWQLRCAELKQRGAFLFKSKLWSDCAFQLDDVTIKAHKLIMAMASPVFSRMLYVERVASPVPIYDVRSEVFNTLLEYIYSDNLNINSSEDACDLYYAAKKWRLPHIAKECAKYLSEQMSPDNVCKIYQVACKTDDAPLQRACEKIFSTKTREVLNDKNFYETDLSTVIRLFSLDPLNIYNELELYEAAVKYADHQEKKMESSKGTKRAATEEEHLPLNGDPSPAKKPRADLNEPEEDGNHTNTTSPHKKIGKDKDNGETLWLRRIVFSPDQSSQDSHDTASASTDTNAQESLHFSTDDKHKEKYRNLIRQIRFLTLSPREFAECQSLSSLLTVSDILAVSLNISSNETIVDMPEGFSTAMVPRTQATKEDRSRLAAVYRSFIHNFKYVKKYESTPFYLRNFAWTLMMMDNVDIDVRLFAVTCFHEGDIQEWMANTKVRVKFCSHKTVPKQIQKVSLKWSASGSTPQYSIWMKKLSRNELFNPEHGFIDNLNALMYKVYVNTVPKPCDSMDEMDGESSTISVPPTTPTVQKVTLPTTSVTTPITPNAADFKSTTTPRVLGPSVTTTPTAPRLSTLPVTCNNKVTTPLPACKTIARTNPTGHSLPPSPVVTTISSRDPLLAKVPPVTASLASSPLLPGSALRNTLPHNTEATKQMALRNLPPPITNSTPIKPSQTTSTMTVPSPAVTATLSSSHPLPNSRTYTQTRPINTAVMSSASTTLAKNLSNSGPQTNVGSTLQASTAIVSLSDITTTSSQPCSSYSSISLTSSCPSTIVTTSLTRPLNMKDPPISSRAYSPVNVTNNLSTPAPQMTTTLSLSSTILTSSQPISSINSLETCSAKSSSVSSPTITTTTPTSFTSSLLPTNPAASPTLPSPLKSAVTTPLSFSGSPILNKPLSTLPTSSVTAPIIASSLAVSVVSSALSFMTSHTLQTCQSSVVHASQIPEMPQSISPLSTAAASSNRLPDMPDISTPLQIPIIESQSSTCLSKAVDTPILSTHETLTTMDEEFHCSPNMATDQSIRELPILPAADLPSPPPFCATVLSTTSPLNTISGTTSALIPSYRPAVTTSVLSFQPIHARTIPWPTSLTSTVLRSSGDHCLPATMNTTSSTSSPTTLLQTMTTHEPSTTVSQPSPLVTTAASQPSPLVTTAASQPSPLVTTAASQSSPLVTTAASQPSPLVTTAVFSSCPLHAVTVPWPSKSLPTVTFTNTSLDTSSSSDLSKTERISPEPVEKEKTNAFERLKKQPLSLKEIAFYMLGPLIVKDDYDHMFD